jgi:hypothetical protein
VEERFRRAAMKKFGYGAGVLDKATESALDEWASKLFSIWLLMI